MCKDVALTIEGPISEIKDTSKCSLDSFSYPSKMEKNDTIKMYLKKKKKSAKWTKEYSSSQNLPYSAGQQRHLGTFYSGDGFKEGRGSQHTEF